MAEPSQNNINLYKHYIDIAPKKERQAAVLLKMFPELEKLSKPEEPVKPKAKEVKKNAKVLKR